MLALDFSVCKTFALFERIRAQVRAEALNATKTVTFGSRNIVLASSQFGLIRAQGNNPQMLQLGVPSTS